MAAQTEKWIWVHGNSGHIEIVKRNEKWGKALFHGRGMYLEGNLQEIGWDSHNSREPWVHFHIPTPIDEEHPMDLAAVFLRISTDFDAPYDPNEYPRKEYVDRGGAIVQQVHVWVAETYIAMRDLCFWQTKGLDYYDSFEFPFNPHNFKNKYKWGGVGVSVRLWFKNQYFFNPNDNSVFMDKEGNPQINKNVATKTKRAVISSVGCKFVPPNP